VSEGSRHGLSTLRVDPRSMALSMHGEPVTLPSRPIYVSTDPAARHALVSYTSPSGVTVHAIAPGGAAGSPLAQPPLELGIYAHQVLVDPAGSMAILVARGNVPTASRTEDPGALDVLDYQHGRLTNRISIAPNGGVGFHPRYVGFHPSRPWIFVSLSQQNELGVFEKRGDGSVGAAAQFEVNSLADPEHIRQGQLTGALHVHPNGKFVYLANRAVNAAKVDGKSVFAGGENNVAVFSIDQETGRPTLIQNADTHGMGPVEFAFDPSGRILLVANMMRLWVNDEGIPRVVPPNLAVFRVREDGKLDFVRQYDIDSGERTLFWVGVSSLP
jgi:6-phosphogluconolactonase